MDKYILMKAMVYGMNCRRLLYPLSDTFRRRNTAYRFVETAPQAVSKGA